MNNFFSMSYLYVTYEWPKTVISVFMDIEGLFVILFAGAPRLNSVCFLKGKCVYSNIPVPNM